MNNNTLPLLLLLLLSGRCDATSCGNDDKTLLAMCLSLLLLFDNDCPGTDF